MSLVELAARTDKRSRLYEPATLFGPSGEGGAPPVNRSMEDGLMVIPLKIQGCDAYILLSAVKTAPPSHSHARPGAQHRCLAIQKELPETMLSG